ncbi:MAG: GatB/YqeY domain-containing protein [Anaerolineae bacterium]|nr:GatB/YqeY domain-containing protein [Anaerolineae bacterium]
MSDPKAKLQEALKEAMVAKDTKRRDVIRMTLSEIKQVEIDERKTLAPDEVLTVLQREVKKRRESIEEAAKAGRTDLAEDAEAEIKILETFLPAQLTREAIVALASAAIAESGATSAKDMGKVMGVLMPKVKGQADGKLVNEVVRELLS